LAIDGRGPGKVIFVTRPGELLGTWRGWWEHVWNALRRASAGFYSPAINTDDMRVGPIRAADSGSQLGFTLAAGSDHFGA
jgi:hypothetical protein